MLIKEEYKFNVAISFLFSFDQNQNLKIINEFNILKLKNAIFICQRKIQKIEKTIN